jgi:hypothetical protein
MAWVLGTANQEEIRDLLDKHYEVETITPEREKAFFGGLREADDTDQLIMVYLDVDAIDVILGRF